MCIIFFQFTRNCRELSSKYRLILAANRDEYFHRPAAAAHFWKDAPNVLGGRDKTKHKEGGAWLAVTKSGKIGILTNFRHTSDVDQSKADTSLSPRGHLLVHYLTENASPPAFLDQILNGTKKYSLLNLLVGNFSSQSGFRFFYGSNAFECSKHDYELQPGIHGLCNAEINCPWTKVEEGKKLFSKILTEKNEKEGLIESLFQLMKDDKQYYPNDGGSGKDLDKGRAAPLSAIYVDAPEYMYGTRAMTVILVDNENQVTFIERSMADPMNISDQKWQTQRFEFKLE